MIRLELAELGQNLFSMIHTCENCSKNFSLAKTLFPRCLQWVSDDGGP